MRLILNYGLVILMVSVLSLPLAGQNEDRQPPPPRPYLGARLSSDIPDLLRKHLQLEPEQGLLIENIFRNSPADKAGLDKDDIILSINNEPLTNPHELFRTMRNIGIGDSATAEVIHLGQLRNVTITFEAMGPQFRFDRSGWKYPIEPDESMIFRPGRMFRRQPGDREWIEIPFEQIKEQAQSGQSQLPNLGTQYHFLHDDGQSEFTIVIEGNPNEPTATVIVKTPDKEYFTTAGQIDMLPREYQQTVKNDIEKAKQTFERGRNLRFPPQIDFSQWQQFFTEGGRPPRPDSRGPDPRGRDGDWRRPEQKTQEDPPGSEERLERQLEMLIRQIEQMQERQKALEALLEEKSQDSD